VDPRITSSLTLTLTRISDDGYSWEFAYSASNTSLTPMRMAEVGWDLLFPSDALQDKIGTAVSPFGPFTARSSGAFAPLGERDLCLNTGGLGCAGVATGGLTSPGSDGAHSGGGTFKIVFVDRDCHPGGIVCDQYAAPTALTFDDFAVRYFSMPVNSPSAGVGVAQQSVAPEPSAWALAITGFCGVGASLRRRRARAA
jgi:hypothetical protein